MLRACVTGMTCFVSPSKDLLPSAGPPESQRLLMGHIPLVVGAPSYGALEDTGRIRCGPYETASEAIRKQEVPSRHTAAQRLPVPDRGVDAGTQ